MSNILKITQHDGNQLVLDETDVAYSLLGAFQLINDVDNVVSEIIDMLSKYSEEQAEIALQKYLDVKNG